ncbi:MAG: glycosyltransferase family 4 protein [Candidatus Riflebacteria bacterium]|nr:glycosyltransferase family 4 protein [Candidatus Riflebacteria bacterium]
MKIIQILNSPNWSAASNYCILASKELLAMGHEVLLITEPGIPYNKAIEYNIPVNCNLRLNHRNPRKFLQAFKLLKTIFREFKPDIISAHINEGAWMPGLVARYACPDAVVARIRTDIDAPKGHFVNRYVHNHWVDHIIAGSNLHKQNCHDVLDYSNEKISVVYGGVDTKLFSPSNRLTSTFRGEVGVKNDELLLGLVARLSPVKGHKFLIEAFSEVCKVNKKVKLACIGYESELSFDWLKELAREHNVADKLICVGRRTNIEKVIAGIDIGLITSIGSEANTRAGLEYMASGKPVIGTSVGVVPEVIADKVTGFIIPHSDSRALSEAIMKLVQNNAMRQLMGQSSRYRAEQVFSLDKFAQNMEKTYRNLLERKSVK